MHALVYHGPGKRSWEEVPDPTIQDDTDVIIQVDTTTICGTDLHILKGDVPAVTDGRILGHEAVGTVTEVGSGVKNLQVGDRVLASCITSCGRCSYCRKGMYSHCQGGGSWIFGHLIDGVQAEYARVPFADTSTYKLAPEITDDQVIYLSDIFPTGYEIGVLNGGVQPGSRVVIIGAGPIGLAAMTGAKLFSPGHILMIDPAASRREHAIKMGADNAVSPEDAEAAVAELGDGLGADVVMEAVGIPETFEQATRLVRPGGTVANIGVHGKPATLHLEDLWIKNIKVTTGLVNTFATPELLDLVVAGRLDLRPFTTHTFRLDQAMEAYDTFADAAKTNALKVLLTRS